MLALTQRESGDSIKAAAKIKTYIINNNEVVVYIQFLFSALFL